MMKSLSIDPGTFGSCCQLSRSATRSCRYPGGALADRFGAKLVLVAAPVLWSVFTGLTGLVETVSALIAVRLCFGLAEGSSNAACYKLVGDNFSSGNARQPTASGSLPSRQGRPSWPRSRPGALRTVGWEQMFLWVRRARPRGRGRAVVRHTGKGGRVWRPAGNRHALAGMGLVAPAAPAVG